MSSGFTYWQVEFSTELSYRSDGYTDILHLWQYPQSLPPLRYCSCYSFLHPQQTCRKSRQYPHYCTREKFLIPVSQQQIRCLEWPESSSLLTIHNAQENDWSNLHADSTRLRKTWENTLLTLAARSRTPLCSSSWRFRSNESSSSRNFACAFTEVVISYRRSACNTYKQPVNTWTTVHSLLPHPPILLKG